MAPETVDFAYLMWFFSKVGFLVVFHVQMYSSSLEVALVLSEEPISSHLPILLSTPLRCCQAQCQEFFQVGQRSTRLGRRCAHVARVREDGLGTQHSARQADQSTLAAGS